MKLEAFIQQEILHPRLQSHQVLVVYDDEQRYHDLCSGLASEQYIVINGSQGTLASRFAALETFTNLHEQQLLIYLPYSAPISDSDKQGCPFAALASAGAIFPDPARSGDQFQNICLKAKPDQATALRQLFESNPQPDFSTVNAVGGGTNWPILQSMFAAEGATSLILKLLLLIDSSTSVPKDGWIDEAKSLLSQTLSLNLSTKSTSPVMIAEEVWRFVLFSEFVLDLEEATPIALSSIAVAPKAAEPVIHELCEQLRCNTQYQLLYMERAAEIESELQLRQHCGDVSRLGRYDTFPFEEQIFLQQALQAIIDDYDDLVRETVAIHANSVWSINGENQSSWELIKAAHQLLICCYENEERLSHYLQSLDSLISGYQQELRKVDQYHREFEQAVNDCELDERLIDVVIEKGRQAYRSIVGKTQQKFSYWVTQNSWPPNGYLCNSELFDQKVEPVLKQSGQRVAYLMVDALRYETGVELWKSLSVDVEADIRPAFSVLPSITSVGMASLLPDAKKSLSISTVKDSISPHYQGKPVGDVKNRMEVFRNRFGDRFREMTLKTLVKARKKFDANIELLVIRSTEIDSFFENHPDEAPAMMQRELKSIRRAVNKLQDWGFHKAFIVTDHGFYMNNASESGDVAVKPEGDWHKEHDRILWGKGNRNIHHYQWKGSEIGLESDIDYISGPFSLAPYRKGMSYYHGGLSLQESLVPVIEATLHHVVPQNDSPGTVILQYKNGKTDRITARFAVIELSLAQMETGDLFAKKDDISSMEIILEAYNDKKEVIGEAKPGDHVNAATGTIMLEHGKPIKVTLKMDPDFEGSFTVKAINPINSVVCCQPLLLKTDYAV